MTFCLGVRLKEGLLGISDTRVTSGSETITARKLWTFQAEGAAMFVMTSGLRALRHKVLTYYEYELGSGASAYPRLFMAVNGLAAQVRRVAEEDGAALRESRLSFDITCLVGGQMADDREPRLYLLYPQGNWVEVEPGTPYQIIGNSGYGKPVLDRVLKYEDSMRLALKVGILSFDSTRISANDVDFPIDVVLYRRDSYRLAHHRYTKDDLAPVSLWWQEHLRELVNGLPAEWMEAAFARLDGAS